MVEQKICTFCGASIEPGTGKMYVKKDGTTYLFCSNKCSKNMIEMGRVPRKVTWTAAYAARKGLATEARNLKAAESAPKEELAPVEQKALPAPAETAVVPAAKAKPAKAKAAKPKKEKEPKEAKAKPAKAPKA
jgi:large subunit ribosomal protein L24e